MKTLKLKPNSVQKVLTLGYDKGAFYKYVYEVFGYVQTGELQLLSAINNSSLYCHNYDTKGLHKGIHPADIAFSTAAVKGGTGLMVTTQNLVGKLRIKRVL